MKPKIGIWSDGVTSFSVTRVDRILVTGCPRTRAPQSVLRAHVEMGRRAEALKRDEAIRGKECKEIILARFFILAYESWRKRYELFHATSRSAFTRRKAKGTPRERIGGLKFCEKVGWIVIWWLPREKTQLNAAKSRCSSKPPTRTRVVWSKVLFIMCASIVHGRFK